MQSLLGLLHGMQRQAAAPTHLTGPPLGSVCLWVAKFDKEGIYKGVGDGKEHASEHTSGEPCCLNLTRSSRQYMYMFTHVLLLCRKLTRQKQEAALAAEREAGARRAEAEASKRQQEAAHNDAVAAFQTLLAETVKEPSARWQVSEASRLTLLLLLVVSFADIISDTSCCLFIGLDPCKARLSVRCQIWQFKHVTASFATCRMDVGSTASDLTLLQAAH